jgi:hypothetical protein
MFRNIGGFSFHQHVRLVDQLGDGRLGSWGEVTE